MPQNTPAFTSAPPAGHPAGDTPDYTPLIRRIKRRRGLVTALIILATLIPLLFIGPGELVLLGRAFTLNGLSVGAAVAIILGGWLVGLILGVIVLFPVGNALILEADPAKYLTLQEGLFTFTTTAVQKATVRCGSYLLMGNYAEAIRHADILTHTQKPAPSAVGLFCKGRAAFLSGDAETLSAATKAFSRITESMGGSAYPKQRALLELMTAILQEDRDTAARLSPAVTAWEATRLPEAQVDYCRARAALLLMETSAGEERRAHRNEAIHRLLSCREKGGRSVLTALAKEALAALPPEAQEQGD
jgi:hypothetical protein